jgi:hypothetical protein
MLYGIARQNIMKMRGGEGAEIGGSREKTSQHSHNILELKRAFV